MEANIKLIQQNKKIFDNEIIFKKVHLWVEIKYRYSYELEDNVYDKITDFVNSIIDRSDIDALIYFIEHHKDSNLAYFYFLQKSIKKNNIKVFHFLLNQSIETDFNYLLKEVINNREVYFVEGLLKKVSDIDVLLSNSTYYYSTFLSLSVGQIEFYNKEDYYQIIDLLLSRGANPYIDLRTSSAKEYPDTFINSASIIYSVNHKEDTELLKIFLKYGVSIQYFSLKRFLQITNFDIDVLRIFTSHCYNISNFFDDYEFGFKNDELMEQVERLLPDAPMEIIHPILTKSSIIGKYDIKLLYYSAMANRLDIIKLLIKLGANARFLHSKSMANFFFAGAPKYRTFTVLLNEQETLASIFYSADHPPLKFWSLQDYLDTTQDINLEKMANSLLNSFSNIIVQYLVSNGAPANWHHTLPEILKFMIVKDEYVENAKHDASYYSKRDAATEGWNSAFEIFPGEGSYPDYI